MKCEEIVNKHIVENVDMSDIEYRNIAITALNIAMDVDDCVSKNIKCFKWKFISLLNPKSIEIVNESNKQKSVCKIDNLAVWGRVIGIFEDHINDLSIYQMEYLDDLSDNLKDYFYHR